METKDNKRPSILACLFMDFLSVLSVFLPGLGELSDFMWAPITYAIFHQVFGSGLPGRSFAGIITFVKEVLPFTDFLPTYTLFRVLIFVMEATSFGSKVLQKKN
eukprot:PhF_6_TR21599/c0_g1_i1/m.30779